jgi:DeoR family fructose operon transcriptional repressor
LSTKIVYYFLFFLLDYFSIPGIIGYMTTVTMDKGKVPVFAEERKRQILEIIHKNRKIVVPELCACFGVSASTIRNDLRDLNDSNLITRTHGGAISNSKVSLEPLPVDKQSHMYLQKAAIARRAADLVDDGDVIALCTGTSVMELARALLEKKKLTIVLNDIQIAAFLEQSSDFTLLMLGGIIRRGFHYVNIHAPPLPNINIDKAFFSCNGLNAATGATVPDFNLAADTAELLSLASEIVLLCDSSKIGTVTFAQIAPLEKIDVVIVDSNTDPQDIQDLRICDRCQIVVAPALPV